MWGRHFVAPLVLRDRGLVLPPLLVPHILRSSAASALEAHQAPRRLCAPWASLKDYGDTLTKTPNENAHGYSLNLEGLMEVAWLEPYKVPSTQICDIYPKP